MNKFCSLLLALFFCSNAFASHFSGGEIRYEYNGTNYDVYLTLYRLCENGATLPNSAMVRVESASQSRTFNQALSFINYDTVDINCPNSTNRCYNVTGTLPGYIQANFKGTVTLPAQANDWRLSWNSCCRINSMVNINSGSFYVDAWIDNSTAINSNAKMVTAPTYYLSVGDTAKVPLSTVDPEGDSIAYKFINPLEGLNNLSTYTTGYSITQPLGAGSYTAIDASTHTLLVKPIMQGSFTIAFEVEEYRNGVKVGTHIRDITVVALSSLTTLSFPQQNTTNASRVYTCPGQSNTVVLNYFDPVVTDSVYLDVVFPNLTGWNFSANTTNGIPNATTTITWTTPSNFNPATLPHFYIKVKARDNACPSSTAEYSLLVSTRQCLADSVWPGDANGDFTVNIYDPLHIAIAHGQTGPSRSNQGVNWAAKPCLNWNNVFVTNNTNMKHADCNGNGVVNNQDLVAVNVNYSKSHPKGGRSKTTGVNDLYFDMTGILLERGKTVSIPIKLGTSSQTITNVYGLGTRININGIQLDNAPTIKTNNSWIDNTTTAVNFVQDINTSSIDWAHARTDQQDVSGNGEIGTLEFTIPANAVVGSQVTFSFENPVLINNKGERVFDFNTTEEKGIVIYPASVSSIDRGLISMSIVPNPSENTAHLNLSMQQTIKTVINITDVTGKVIWSRTETYNAGNTQITLPANKLASGIYMIRVTTNGSEPSVMKWIKR